MIDTFHKPFRQLRTGLFFVLFALFCTAPALSQAQNETITPGSFVIDMGVIPQTVGNGLKPYGMIYDLISNYKIPIKWVINSGKPKDGTDFTYNGRDFKGGPFVVLAEYRTTAVNSRITYWQGQGVIGITTTSPIDVPVAITLQVSSVPRWTLDLQNGSLAIPYFTNAGIPASAYNAPKTNPKLPSALGYCDDIFVLPHADPAWSTHKNLVAWNLTYHGSIWTSCHAGSTLSDMFNPAIPSQQSNFLSEKSGVATGSGPYCENSLVMYDNHTNGTPPYSYTNTGFDDPFMQFMGTIDAATQNGSEQVYIPVPASLGWRSTTEVAIYDNIGHPSSDAAHRAAIVAYGRGFGDANRGYVMFEAAHSHAKATLPANIAAQRIFFNFSFMAGKDGTILPNVSGIPATVSSGTPSPVSFTYPVTANPSELHITWYSSCGGTFSADPTHPNDSTHMIFNPPAVPTNTYCPITVSIKDNCDRIFNTSQTTMVTCDMQVSTTLANACNAGSNGSITMTITGAAAPYNWSWNKTGGGTGSGTGTVISGLAAGTYTATVTSGGGAGCAKTFTVTINSSPAINALSITPNNLLCYGVSTGSITVANASGGTPPFTYLWADGSPAVSTQNRTGLAAGTYSVTAKDANNCTVTSGSVTLTQPTNISITPTVTNASCYGQPSGAISIVVAGGTGVYRYSWNDGPTTQNRTGLAAGTYMVTVTDANNCTRASSGNVVSQPSSVVSLSATSTDVACNGGATGTITLTPSGGTPGYTYSWTGGVTTKDRTGLAAGNYTVTTTDSKGCQAILTKTIAQAATLTLSTTIVNESCSGKVDGSVTLIAGGGTAPYTYKKGTGTFVSSNSFTGLSAGSYTFTVKDAGNCTTAVTVSVVTNPTLTATPAASNLICGGVAAGSITLSVSGGNPTYTFSWGGGITTQNRSGLAAGTYNVTVTDSKGCTATASSTLTQPATIAITPTVTNATCNGSLTGQISLAVTGGTGAYSYVWSDGSSSQNRTGLAAGTYSVTVTDASNCSQTSSGIVVSQPSGSLGLSATSVNVACNGASTGSITLTPSGGSSPYTYNWGGSVTSNPRTGLAAGDYSVTATDAKGCTAVLSKKITQTVALNLNTTITQASCLGQHDGSIALTVTGGTAGYTYAWTGPSSFTSTSASPTGLLAGTYNLTVTDASGCTATTVATVTNTSPNPVVPGAITK